MKKPPAKEGRKPIFESPDELLDLFLDYIDDCIENNEVPNIPGFRANKGIKRSTYNDYEHKPEFSDVFDTIDDMLHDKTLNSKAIDPTTKKLVLQSKFGYADIAKNQNHNENINTNTDVLQAIKENMSTDKIKELIDKMKGDK